jgi:membrane protein
MLRVAQQWTKDFVAAIHHGYEDNCFILAKAVSYSAVMALFPGLIVVTHLLLRNNAHQTIDDIAVAIGEVLPPRVRDMLVDFLTVSDDKSALVLALAGLAAVVFASDLVITLMEGFRAAYNAPRRHTAWHDYGIAVALVFLSIGPLTLAQAGLILSRQFESWAVQLGASSSWIAELALVIWWAIAIPTVAGILALLYYVAPHRQQKWRHVFPGALMAACLWAFATGFFTLYAQNVPRYREFYGSLSAVIVLLIWTYLSSVIVLLGCEFNAVRERRRTEPTGAAAPG